MSYHPETDPTNDIAQANLRITKENVSIILLVAWTLRGDAVMFLSQRSNPGQVSHTWGFSEEITGERFKYQGHYLSDCVAALTKL